MLLSTKLCAGPIYDRPADIFATGSQRSTACLPKTAGTMFTTAPGCTLRKRFKNAVSKAQTEAYRCVAKTVVLSSYILLMIQLYVSFEVDKCCSHALGSTMLRQHSI